MAVIMGIHKSKCGNNADKLRHTRSVAYSAELVLLNKQQISGDGGCLRCYRGFGEYNQDRQHLHFFSTGLYTTDRYASKAVRVSVYCATHTKRKPDVLCTQGHRQHIMLVFTFSNISINNNVLAYKAPVCQKTSEAPKHPESSFLNCCTGSKIPTHHSNYEISSLA